ncbi:hypothetical protein NP0151_08900 [Helicobacter pylori]
MLIPFLKIPAHYSASDRAGLKRVEKNSKIKKRKQWGLAKRKRLIPQKKEISLKKDNSKKEKLQKKEFQKKRVQKKEF